MSKERKKKKESNPWMPIIALGIIVAIIVCVVLFFELALPKIKKVLNEKGYDVQYSEYAYSDYNGIEIPTQLVTFFKNSDEEEPDILSYYGKVMTIGDREISYPLAYMMYVDGFYKHFRKAVSDTKNYGYSTESFSLEYDPQFSDYDDDTSWAEYIMDEAADEYAEYFYLYDEGMKAGYRMDDSELKVVLKTYQNIVDTDNDPNDVVEAYYTEGLTINGYMKYYFIKEYAMSYRDYLKEEISNDISDDELTEKLEGKEKYYKVFSGKIFPVTKEVDGMDVTDIKTEEQMMEYAEAVYDGSEDINDYMTVNYENFTFISKKYGPEIANFIFGDSIKIGQVNLVKNNQMWLLVYTDEEPYYETSIDCLIYYVNRSTDEDDAADEQEYYESLYNRLLDEGLTEARMESLAISVSAPLSSIPEGEVNLRVGDLDSEIDQWLRDPARKEGDTKLFVLDSFFVIIYYKHVNTEDYDWLEAIRESTVKTQYEEKFDLTEAGYTYNIDTELETKLFNMAHETIVTMTTTESDSDEDTAETITAVITE